MSMEIKNLQLYGDSSAKNLLSLRCQPHREELQNTLNPDITELFATDFFKNTILPQLRFQTDDSLQVRILESSLHIEVLRDNNSIQSLDIGLKGQSQKLSTQILKKANDIYERCMREPSHANAGTEIDQLREQIEGLQKQLERLEKKHPVKPERPTPGGHRPVHSVEAYAISDHHDTSSMDSDASSETFDSHSSQGTQTDEDLEESLRTSSLPHKYRPTPLDDVSPYATQTDPKHCTDVSCGEDALNTPLPSMEFLSQALSLANTLNADPNNREMTEEDMASFTALPLEIKNKTFFHLYLLEMPEEKNWKLGEEYFCQQNGHESSNEFRAEALRRAVLFYMTLHLQKNEDKPLELLATFQELPQEIQWEIHRHTWQLAAPKDTVVDDRYGEYAFLSENGHETTNAIRAEAIHRYLIENAIEVERSMLFQQIQELQNKIQGLETILRSPV